MHRPEDQIPAKVARSLVNWTRVLDRYGVQYLILDRAGDSDLVQLFEGQPGWAAQYEDEEAVLFARSPNRPVAPP